MERTAQQATGGERPTERRARVVVAEDDEAVRRIVVRTLALAGHDVIDVPDGGRLLVFITRCCRGEEPLPDLIVSDVRMPVMTGLGMLKGVRDAHWKVPVILMTGFPSLDLLVHAEHLHALVLPKPFTAEGLVHAVDHQLTMAHP